MKGIFIPEITVEMFRNGCFEAIEELMVEGEIYDIEYDPKSAKPEKVLVAEVKLSKDQIQSAVDEAVEKMRKELDPCDFCKHKDDCGYLLAYCPAERREE